MPVEAAGDLVFDFFISYPGAARAEARVLYEQLEKRFCTFLDQFRLTAGSRWPADIPKVIDRSRVFVALISSEGDGGFFNTEELILALNLMRRDPGARAIVPVYLRGAAVEPQRAPFGLLQFQALFLELIGYPGVTGQLADVLERVRAGAPVAAPAVGCEPAAGIPIPDPQGLEAGVAALTGTLPESTRRAVGHSLQVFAHLRCGFELLAAFKDLHDQLHTLHVGFHEPLRPYRERAAKDPFEDDDAGGEYREYLAVMYDVVIEIDRLRTSWPMLDAQFALLDRLRNGVRQFEAALDKRDGVLFRRALLQIDRVLTLSLPAAAAKLQSSAEALQLASFLTVLDLAVVNLANKGADPQSISEIRSFLPALYASEARLQRLVKHHSRWQAFQTEVQMLAGVLCNPEELATYWADVEIVKRASDLWDGEGEMAAVRLRSVVERVDGAIKRRDERAIDAEYRGFRRTVIQRFYRVDKELKEVCATLWQKSEPLVLMVSRAT